MGSDHEFQIFDGLPACAKCGMVQRADGLNKPCAGRPPAIEVRLVGAVDATTTGKKAGER